MRNTKSRIDKKVTKKQPASKRVLSAKHVDNYLKFMLFLALIGMFYIWNSHYAERQMRELDELKKDVKSLKSKYIIKEAQLSAGTRYSEVSGMADSLDMKLTKLSSPPYRINIEGGDK